MDDDKNIFGLIVLIGFVLMVIIAIANLDKIILAQAEADKVAYDIKNFECGEIE